MQSTPGKGTNKWESPEIGGLQLTSSSNPKGSKCDYSRVNEVEMRPEVEESDPIESSFST